MPSLLGRPECFRGAAGVQGCLCTGRAGASPTMCRLCSPGVFPKLPPSSDPAGKPGSLWAAWRPQTQHTVRLCPALTAFPPGPSVPPAEPPEVRACDTTALAHHSVPSTCREEKHRFGGLNSYAVLDHLGLESHGRCHPPPSHSAPLSAASGLTEPPAHLATPCPCCPPRSPPVSPGSRCVGWGLTGRFSRTCGAPFAKAGAAHTPEPPPSWGGPCGLVPASTSAPPSLNVHGVASSWGSCGQHRAGP